LTPRTALVTGGTRGIGLGIARRLLLENWRLILAGVRRESELGSLLDDLRAGEHEVHYVQADIADPGARRRLVDAVRARCGAVDALVNNAGRAPDVRADILDATEASFETLVRTNLQGPYFLTQAIARDQIARRRSEPPFAPSIVFITSVSAGMVSVNRGDYCVSKAGLSMAARLFAVRLASEGIPVYEVRPGIVATDMTAGVRETYDSRIAGGLVPEQRWGQPDDVGRIVAALVRGDAPYATGTVIDVDGGLSIPRL
jgi:NAD(P)-dependent dehydrogenase (short-subunit alcohol dehydrogenase family)